MSGKDEEFKVEYNGQTLNQRCDQSEHARKQWGTFRMPSMPFFKFLTYSRYEEKYGDDK